jgi:AraC-like DNA-binding protein
MQNQPQLPHEYAPFIFNPAFPVAGGPHALTDKPITVLHQHNSLEIGYCHHGAGIFVIEDKVLPFRTGDISIISEAEMHLAQSAVGTVSHWTFINIDPQTLVPTPADERWLLITEPFHGADFRNILSLDQHPRIVFSIKTIIDEMLTQPPGYQSAIRAQVWTLMLELHRMSGTASTRWTGDVINSRVSSIARALEVIATGYSQTLRMEELAAACYCSVTHFRRQFTAAMGQSPQSYLTKFRLQMATTLLKNTTQSIAEIAGAVGFTTLSSFNRHFKSLIGISPRQLRKSMHCEN